MAGRVGSSYMHNTEPKVYIVLVQNAYLLCLRVVVSSLASLLGVTR